MIIILILDYEQDRARTEAGSYLFRTSQFEGFNKEDLS